MLRAVPILLILAATPALAQAKAPVAPDGEPYLCPPETHPRPARETVGDPARALFDGGRWAELEAELKRLRAAPRLEGDFVAVLSYALRVFRARDVERVDAWVAAAPSWAAHLVRGFVGVDLAWEARGAGWARDVGDQAFRRFDEQLRAATEHLRKAEALDPKDAWAPGKLITCAMGGALPPDEARAAFDRAVKNDPRHFEAYECMVTFLLPRWHGTPAELSGFVEEQIAAHPEHVELLFLRFMARKNVAARGSTFLSTAEEQREMAALFDRMLEAYPKAHLLLGERLTLAGLMKDADAGERMFDALFAAEDPRALSAMAVRCMRGTHGEARDLARSIRFMCRAAHRGEAGMQFELGRLHLLGTPEIPRDVVAGARWARRSAERGDRDGACLWARCLAEGAGAPKDPAGARRWFDLAARAQSAEAMGHLAVMLSNGEGGPADTAAAQRWVDEGTRLGDIYCMLLQADVRMRSDPPAAADWLRRAIQTGPQPGHEGIVEKAQEDLRGLLKAHPDLRRPGDPE